VYGTGDDVIGPMVKPAAANYTNHTSPYIDQSQSYGSDEQITSLLRAWVKDPNYSGPTGGPNQGGISCWHGIV
jgi:hypothetical protein